MSFTLITNVKLYLCKCFFLRTLHKITRSTELRHTINGDYLRAYKRHKVNVRRRDKKEMCFFFYPSHSLHRILRNIFQPWGPSPTSST